MSAVTLAVRRLRGLTESQVEAARELRGDALQALNDERADALFALRILLADGTPPAGADLADEVRRLGLAERRLAALARAVLHAVSPPGPAATYGRTGRIGG